MQTIAWLANASLISITSSSSAFTPARFSAFCVAGTGPIAHDLRRAARDRDALDAREHVELVLRRVFLGADQRRRGAVGQRRRGARRHRALGVESRLQPGQLFGRRVRGGCSRPCRRRCRRRRDRHDFVLELARRAAPPPPSGATRRRIFPARRASSDICAPDFPPSRPCEI